MIMLLTEADPDVGERRNGVGERATRQLGRVAREGNSAPSEIEIGENGGGQVPSFFPRRVLEIGAPF